MARADRQAAVAEIVDSFNDAAGAVLTEYRGLTVKQLQELRRSLGANANYAVVKNTLAKLAATEAGIEGFDDLLTGPTAIAFIKGDVVGRPRVCVTLPRPTPPSSSRVASWTASLSARRRWPSWPTSSLARC